jgi:hypothetical protein
MSLRTPMVVITAGLLVIALAVPLVLLSRWGLDAPGPAEPGAERAAARLNPLVRETGGVANVSFYYDGTLPLAGADPEKLRAKLGEPAIVVTTPRDAAAEIKAIHGIGAKAYRYVQFFWAPGTEEYEGIDLNEHPDWAFCRSGSAPSLGRTTAPRATPWYFLDANETAVRKRITEVLAGYEAQGWDGVFFDRGEAATQYARDSAGRPVWSKQSSCTEAPHRRGATFADAYVDTVGLARQVGLETMMNNGKSPFDPVVPMRPDPADRDCRVGRHAQCATLSDGWNNLELVLSEAAGRPKDVLWERTFVGNKRAERNAKHGRRTVGLITTATLGGQANQTRRDVYYQWSRIKLFDMAVAVNTGDDRCADAADPDAICNRYGVYPELTSIRFGEPLERGPSSEACLRRSEVRCVWTRHYAAGADVANVRPKPQERQVVRLGTRGCRYVFDVWAGKPAAGSRCVNRVVLSLPAWSGRPLLYSKKPW